MNTERPGNQNDVSAPKANENLTSEQIAQIDATRDRDRTRLADHERSEARRGDLSDFVIDHWDETRDSTTCFGIEVDPSYVPDHLVDVLLKIEAETGFDLIMDGLAPEDVGLLVTQELATQSLEAQAAQKHDDLATVIETTEELKQSKDSYANLIADLRASGASNAEIILTLKDNPDVPEAERAKLTKFSQIIEIAKRVPEDAEVINHRIGQLDFANGVPDPVNFAKAFILDAASGVSEATQTAVAETLGIERPNIDVNTGGDIADVFEKGIGMR